MPFVVADGAERAQAFALAIPLPTFFGLIGKLSSALVPYLIQQGVIGIAVEGGQHEAASSVDHHEAVLWIALVAAGVLAAEALPDLAAFHALLADARHGLPQAIEVYHRHGIVPEDEFRMAPGFANLQPIARGTLLARDRRGEIRAPEDCLLVMPLYQGLGDDGFFLGRELRTGRAALGLSRWRRFLPASRGDAAGVDSGLPVHHPAARGSAPCPVSVIRVRLLLAAVACRLVLSAPTAPRRAARRPLVGLVLADRLGEGPRAGQPLSTLYCTISGMDQPHTGYQIHLWFAAEMPCRTATWTPDAWRFDLGGCQGPSFGVIQLTTTSKTCPTLAGLPDAVRDHGPALFPGRLP